MARRGEKGAGTGGLKIYMETIDRNDSCVIALGEEPSPEAAAKAEAALLAVPGILRARREGLVWEVVYLEGAVSKLGLEDCLRSSGIALAAGVKPKGFLSRWLASLAESNRDFFGSETPDCCKLNRKQNIGRNG